MKRVLLSGVVLLLVAGLVVVRSLQSGCRSTFAYTVPIENPSGQEDWRQDAAILVDGEERIVTTDHAAMDVAISPDGERVVVAKGTGPIDDELVGIDPVGLDIYDVDGSDGERLTDSGGTQPDWSPDGSEIAFISDRSIRVINVDDRQEREIFRLARAEVDQRLIAAVAWSSGSDRVAFTTSPLESGDSAVWSVKDDGTDLRRHFFINDDDINELEWFPGEERFAWSGAFKGVRSVVFAGPSGELTQVEPNSEDPVWSADGSQLAYVIGHEGHYEFRIVLGDEMGAGETAVPKPEDARGGTSLDDWASC